MVVRPGTVLFLLALVVVPVRADAAPPGQKVTLDARPDLTAGCAGTRVAALAAADLDRDGRPELVAGFSCDNGGRLVVYGLGPRDEWPAVTRTEVVAVGLRVDFVGVGDVDGDGREEIVFSHVGATRLGTVADRGAGSYEQTGSTPLGAPLRALAVEDASPQDGLPEVLVTVGAAGDPVLAKSLVFAGPMGALRHAPVESARAVEERPVTAVTLRLGRDARPDLVTVAEDGALEATLSGVASLFVVDSTGDAPDLLPGNGTCATASGTCTLRAAIEEANALPGPDAIQFALGPGVPTITPLSPLPVVVESLDVYGDTGGATRIQIAGQLAGPVANGLVLGASPPRTSTGSTLRALVVNRFANAGVRIETGQNVVEDCRLGTDPAGGATVAGNGLGVFVTGANATGNLVGGSAVADRCVISNNSGVGVRISEGASSNTVAGSLVGLDASGAVAVPNGGTGVLIVAGSANVVGGATSATGDPPGNLISGNAGAGTEITGANARNNLVQGNLVGLRAGGTIGAGNARDGVRLAAGAHDNHVGGSTVALRNVISGNGGALSSAAADGVEINGASSNIIRGNTAGLDASGTTPVPNAGNGVSIIDELGPSTGNTVGGSSPGETNTLSGNKGSGVRVGGGGSTSNSISGNNVGTSGSGVITTVPGNEQAGVLIDGGATGNRVGGVSGLTPGQCTGECNRIGYNGTSGVAVVGAATRRNAVRANTIASNDALGIDLGADGVTPNDAFDDDGGPNDLQNFPAILSATVAGLTTFVTGTLDSTPNTVFEIDLFANIAPDPAGFGEGRTWLTTITVMTDPLGSAFFNAAVPGSHTWLAATATDPLGNTSEFGKSFANPGEARDLRVTSDGGPILRLDFTPACAASDHVAYRGTTPIAGGVAWDAAFCGLGVSGTALLDPGTPLPGTALYFVVVGQSTTREGPYGHSRPEAVGLGTCDLPLETTATCP